MLQNFEPGYTVPVDKVLLDGSVTIRYLFLHNQYTCTMLHYYQLYVSILPLII